MAVARMITEAGLETTPWQDEILAVVFRVNPDESWAAERLHLPAGHQ